MHKPAIFNPPLQAHQLNGPRAPPAVAPGSLPACRRRRRMKPAAASNPRPIF